MNKREVKLLHMISGVLLLIAIVCLIYYVLIVTYAGIGTSFSWFWVVMATGCIGLSIIIHYIVKLQIIIPKSIKMVVILGFVVGFLTFIILEGMIIIHGNKKPSNNADYMIVLGAQVRGTIVTKALKERLDKSIEYLEENENTIVILSGGQGNGEDISEAQAMNDYLISKGIGQDRILKEDKSKNTNENIMFSKKLIKGVNKKVVIVSNGFHIYRATILAKKQEIGQVEGLGAPTGDILVVSYYTREVFALLKDKVVGNL
jgi:uncharacterized SAM-binding protein YcdF (DUF218 family)